MAKIKKWLAAGVTLLSVTALAACGNNSDSNQSQKQGPQAKLAKTYSASGKATSNDSTLKLAEVAPSPFKGISSSALQDNAEDADVFSPGGADFTTFKTDRDYKIIDGGLINQKIDRQAKTITLTIRPNGKWSNGQPVIAKDIEYAHEVIANKNSTSTHYSSEMGSIVGMKDYHSGKAQTISGFTYPEGDHGKKVVVHYTKMSPAMQYAGNNFLFQCPEPYEYIKDVPIAKLAAAPQIRKNPIFTGPYKLDKMVQGESTSWSINPYYYGAKPKIKHINIQVVSQHNIAAALKAGKYDFTTGDHSVPASQYPGVKKLKNYTWVGKPAANYSYFGFNLGHYDAQKQVNVMDSKAKMNNKKLRQAMMYAVDVKAVNNKFGNGLVWQANSLIPPIFEKYNNKKLTGYKYDLQKAKQLLDEAGYKKSGKWRVQPNGKALTIYFGGMQSSAATESTYRYYIQQWQKVGLNVKMTTGKPMEMNSFYDTLQKPKQNKIDVYTAAWATGTEPSPDGIYGAESTFNMGHFVTKENSKLLNQINNDQAWNDNYRKQQFQKWQAYMNDQAAYVAESFNLQWTPINHRVKNFNDLPQNSSNFWSDLELTAPNPK
ncbi:oligopeptide ABC transporter substrate-binding protein [Lactobacillus sp. DCY120]|uniref:Oligopeptide ABC transporter substrate-binding protein n=1 Tax=Bombilactobacillus apium TaxID=2675299 RepID=A0A850R717_9LACO|nr:oligopeptide ABC transporter substrate-binding protein [Bombilactobacillus apium]NVY96627.1 oligopeptide ABC transporter substrate-binding protein [Bombilactobacillus apium]